MAATFDSTKAPEPSTPGITPDSNSANFPTTYKKTFVVADLMHLARADDMIAEDILMLLVDEVYKNQVPRNRPGREKHEPRLSHLLDLLKGNPFSKKHAAKERSETIAHFTRIFQRRSLDRRSNPSRLSN